MPVDKVSDPIRWPEPPHNLPPHLRDYLLDMQRAIDERLKGSLHVSGDVVVGGYLVLMGPDRIKSYTGS